MAWLIFASVALLFTFAAAQNAIEAYRDAYGVGKKNNRNLFPPAAS